MRSHGERSTVNGQHLTIAVWRLCLALGVASGAQAQVGDLRIARRDIIVTERAEDGSRFVIDAITLVNRSSVAVVPTAPSDATWSGAIPNEVIGLQVAESDFPPPAIRHDGDRIVVAAPVPPGRTRIVLHYVLPPGVARWELMLNHVVDTLTVVTRTGDMTVRGARFAAEELGDAVRPVRRYVATALEAGVEIGFAPARARRSYYAYWWIIVLAAALTMAATLASWLRRNTPLAREGPPL